jgi:hypothetical protein
MRRMRKGSKDEVESEVKMREREEWRKRNGGEKKGKWK